MDFANRTDREKKLLAGLLLLFQDDELLLSPALFESRLRTTLAEHYEAIYVEAATQLAGGSLSSEQMADVERRAAEWASEQAGRTAESFVSNSKSAMAGGVTPEEIDAIFGESRAENIAITEVTRAANQGMEEMAAKLIALGILVGKAIWRTAQDSKVCPTCAPLDGHERSYWSQFAFSGPPAHPRCRCYLLYS